VTEVRSRTRTQRRWRIVLGSVVTAGRRCRPSCPGRSNEISPEPAPPAKNLWLREHRHADDLTFAGGMLRSLRLRVVALGRLRCRRLEGLGRRNGTSVLHRVGDDESGRGDRGDQDQQQAQTSLHSSLPRNENCSFGRTDANCGPAALRPDSRDLRGVRRVMSRGGVKKIGGVAGPDYMSGHSSTLWLARSRTTRVPRPAH